MSPGGVPPPSARSALRIDGDVDRFLHEGAGDRAEETEGPEEHEAEREAHAEQHALHRDRARALRDRHRFDQPVEAVDDEHHVGRLR